MRLEDLTVSSWHIGPGQSSSATLLRCHLPACLRDFGGVSWVSTTSSFFSSDGTTSSLTQVIPDCEQYLKSILDHWTTWNY